LRRCWHYYYRHCHYYFISFTLLLAHYYYYYYYYHASAIIFAFTYASHCHYSLRLRLRDYYYTPLFRHYYILDRYFIIDWYITPCWCCMHIMMPAHFHTATCHYARHYCLSPVLITLLFFTYFILPPLLRHALHYCSLLRHAAMPFATLALICHYIAITHYWSLHYAAAITLCLPCH